MKHMKNKTIGTIILVVSAAVVVHGYYEKSKLATGVNPDMMTQAELGLGGIGAVIGLFMAFSK